MQCPICDEICDNENDLIGHLLVDHNLTPEISLQMAKEVIDGS